ncbi:lipid-binding SYLF domain-containing protein [Ramlibacter rhizophilus]|nr:lipid-binding SYLF domain-containing protein [Ramlibacter rhizophilus]
MNTFPRRLVAAVSALLLATAVGAQPWQPRTAPGEGVNPAREPEPVVVRPASEALEEVRERVREAVQAVRLMKADPQLAVLLQRAQGLFILTDYGRAAVGLGVRGGQGVLVTRQGTDFGNPVFYNMAGLSVGPQIGATGGDAAYLLMTERAVQEFMSDRTFALTAGAGLTFATTHKARGMAATGKVSDVVVWTGAPGLYAGLSVGVMGIRPDGDANRVYYGAEASPLSILSGRVPNPNNNVLAMVLAI